MVLGVVGCSKNRANGTAGTEGAEPDQFSKPVTVYTREILRSPGRARPKGTRISPWVPTAIAVRTFATDKRKEPQAASYGSYPYPLVIKLDTAGNLRCIYENHEVFSGIVRNLVPDNEGGAFIQANTFAGQDTAYYLHVAHLVDGQAIAENSGKGQELRVLMAPNGFWVSGYKGEALIYDPAGRLVLKKEMRSKTLVNPLSPGVYFVVARKERGKVAVR